VDRQTGARPSGALGAARHGGPESATSCAPFRPQTFLQHRIHHRQDAQQLLGLLALLLLRPRRLLALQRPASRVSARMLQFWCLGAFGERPVQALALRYGARQRRKRGGSAVGMQKATLATARACSACEFSRKECRENSKPRKGFELSPRKGKFVRVLNFHLEKFVRFQRIPPAHAAPAEVAKPEHPAFFTNAHRRRRARSILGSQVQRRARERCGPHCLQHS
jgi:hypothetical protein